MDDTTPPPGRSTRNWRPCAVRWRPPCGPGGGTTDCRDGPRPAPRPHAGFPCAVGQSCLLPAVSRHPGGDGRQSIYALGNGQWDIPALRTLLEELLPHHTVFNDYEMTHTFERIGPRTMLLNAHRLDAVQFILLAMEDITVRTQNERRLQQEIAERQRLERAAQQAQHFALRVRV